MFYIYKITCSKSNKIYIGKSTVPIEQRWHRHVKDARTLDTHLARAIRLYGENAFNIEVIDTCEENQEILNDREKYWIAFYDAYNTGYNETKGGEGGNTCSKKSMEEMEKKTILSSQMVIQLTTSQFYPAYGSFYFLGLQNHCEC